jgi:hypothetical protein
VIYQVLWLPVTALALAFLSVCGCAWTFLDTLQRPKRTELKDLLEQYAQTLSADYARRLKLLETEWDDMYQKFGKLAGRMDRQRALDKPATPDEADQPAPTRSEILRKWRSKT